MRRFLWFIAEWAAFIFWLPAAYVVDFTEKIMDASYERTIPKEA